jgi:hypothetical protein
MADDNNPRYPRGGDPFARGGGAAARGGAADANDPLAELARLIGQTDPFADFGREAARPTQTDEPQRWSREDAGEEWRSPPHEAEVDRYAGEQREYRHPDYDDRYAPVEPPRYARLDDGDDADATRGHYADAERDRYADVDRDHYAEAGRDRYAEIDQPQVDPYAADDTARYADRDPYAAPVEHLPPLPGLQSLRSEREDDLRAGDARYADNGEAPVYDDPRYDTREAEYRQAAAAAAPYGNDPYYRDDVQLAPPAASYAAATFDDEDDAPPPRRRGGLVVVMAVLALAFVGTAGAFGYRAMFGPSDSSSPPPVIKADATPSKVVPTPAGGEQQNKISYDRVGDRTQGEKVVVREEQPVDMKDAPGLPPSRSVFPPVTGATQPPATVPSQSSPPPAAALPSSPSSAAQASAGNEPKKVRTVTIRPDKSGGFATVPSTQRPPTATASNSASPFPDPPPPGRSAAARQAAAPAAAVATAPPAASGSEPLALAARNGSPPDVLPRARSAAAPSSARAAAPSGSYSVQVSSQRTEADAQASYRALQAKFPSQLGSREAAIKRADLGDKGIFFRALVGPFSSSEQAAEFCGSLKAAGGQCLIQRN